MEKEVASVTEKHLLLARNLSGTLSRYVRDVKEGFRAAVGIGAAAAVGSTVAAGGVAPGSMAAAAAAAG